MLYKIFCRQVLNVSLVQARRTIPQLTQLLGTMNVKLQSRPSVKFPLTTKVFFFNVCECVYVGALRRRDEDEWALEREWLSRSIKVPRARGSFGGNREVPQMNLHEHLDRDDAP